LIATEFIFFLFLAWFILIIGFKQKDYAIVGIIGLFLMSLGAYVLSNNITGMDSYLKSMVGIVHVGLGFYISIRATIELLKVEPEHRINLWKKVVGWLKQ